MFNCCRDGAVCDCDCHEHPDTVKHCFPCCATCPLCSQHIHYYAYDGHLASCAESARQTLQRVITEKDKPDVVEQLLEEPAKRENLAIMLGRHAGAIRKLIEYLSEDPAVRQKLMEPLAPYLIKEEEPLE
ncbi:MAG: hypothetical protein PHT12_03700 [Patescibacteria group bacterium]|nr:hypothetical protein [Patescibacteria group bacterium]